MPSGSRQGDLGQLEEETVLAGDAFEVLQQFLFDAAFGAGTDAVDHAQQQIHQGVREFALPQMAEDGQQRQL